MPAMATSRLDEAFTAELARHRKLLVKVARLYCRDAADRDDLIQEMSIQLWRSHGSFDGRSQFATWIYRVALNVAISWARGRFRRERLTRDMDEDDFVSLTTHSAERSMADLDLLENMLANLHELDRALMLLHLEGHDHTTIADVLGITATNVATKLNRIKQRLQQQFG